MKSLIQMRTKMGMNMRMNMRIRMKTLIRMKMWMRMRMRMKMRSRMRNVIISRQRRNLHKCLFSCSVGFVFKVHYIQNPCNLHPFFGNSAHLERFSANFSPRNVIISRQRRNLHKCLFSCSVGFVFKVHYIQNPCNLHPFFGNSAHLERFSPRNSIL